MSKDTLHLPKLAAPALEDMARERDERLRCIEVAAKMAGQRGVGEVIATAALLAQYVANGKIAPSDS